MSANTFGQCFRVTTAGESHGKALVAIVDGCPPNMPLDEDDIQTDLNRRKPGKNRYETPRREDDEVSILSGVFEGKTTGTPIALIIHNTDQRSQDYSQIKNVFRPAHADYTYEHKYGIRDYRGGGRSSARETAMRVAAGAIAKKYLKLHGMEIIGFLSQIGPIEIDWEQDNIEFESINSNPFFCPNSDRIADIEHFMTELKKQHNSIGAEITVIVKGVPTGLGEPVFDRLDAEIAHALMSINAVKGVAIGDGFNVITQHGSEHRDELSSQGFKSNHAGGIVGGISSGQNILATVALKPTSSIALIGNTINQQGIDTQIVTKGRHDPCVGIRATPIVEAMTALVLMDHLLRNRAQCGEVNTNTPNIEKIHSNQ